MIPIWSLYINAACILTLCCIQGFLTVIIWRQRRANQEMERRNQGQAQTLNHLVQQVMDAERKAGMRE